MLPTLNPAAEDIAAIAASFTALSVLVGSFTVLIPVLRATKANAVQTERVKEHLVAATTQREEITKELGTVHSLVNSQRDAMFRYQLELIKALKDANVIVPEQLPPSSNPNHALKKET